MFDKCYRMIVNACPQLQILHINSLNLKPVWKSFLVSIINNLKLEKKKKNDFEALTRDEMLSKLPLEEIDVSGNSLKGSEQTQTKTISKNLT